MYKKLCLGLVPWFFEGIFYPHPLQEIKVYLIGKLNQKPVILTFGQLIDHLIISDKLIWTHPTWFVKLDKKLGNQ